MKYFWKTIKYILLSALAIMFAALIYVMWTGRDPASVSGLAATREALDAREELGDLEVVSYKGFDDRTYSQDGGIGVSRVTRIADVDQWQMLVRYNDSTLRELAETRGDAGFDPTERFVFTLQDDLGHVYTDYRFLTEKTTRHSFVRLVFDGVGLSYRTDEGATSQVKRVGEMRLNVYCREDVKDGEYPAAPYCYVYVYSVKAAQYEYKDAEDELSGPAAELRSSAELIDTRKETANK